jgi:hypothetical protein
MYVVSPWFSRENYNAIKAMVGPDTDLPDTFDAWLQRETERMARAEAKGLVAKKAVVDPDKFAAWCRASGVDANDFTLGAFATSIFGRDE